MLLSRDRIRTTSSVVSHTLCTAVVWSLCKKDLRHIDDDKHIHRNETDVTIVMNDSEEIQVKNDKIANGFGNHDNGAAKLTSYSSSDDSFSETSNL